MPTTKSNRSSARHSAEAQEQLQNPKEITGDIVEYLTEYARENPGYAALACLGVGFVLGWKLKPW
ncbi:MAG: hypothetical protein WD063_10090 [Pirellulales bacterium]|jgi:hypothetical protein